MGTGRISDVQFSPRPTWCSVAIADVSSPHAARSRKSFTRWQVTKFVSCWLRPSTEAVRAGVNRVFVRRFSDHHVVLSQDVHSHAPSSQSRRRRHMPGLMPCSHWSTMANSRFCLSSRNTMPLRRLLRTEPTPSQSACCSRPAKSRSLWHGARRPIHATQLCS